VSSTIWLRVNGVVEESVVDGPGIRFTIFTQGCPHHCEGCHNPQTHDFDGGELVDAQSLIQRIQEDPLLSGVTFSGGEPFCQAEALGYIAKAVHAMGKTVMSYSGWTLEELLKKAERESGVAALLAQTDILVDGPFLLKERDLTLQFRGSRNQRLLDLRELRKNKEI